MGEKVNLAAAATSTTAAAGAGLLDTVTGVVGASASSMADSYRAGLQEKLVEGAVAGTVDGLHNARTRAREANGDAIDGDAAGGHEPAAGGE